MMKNIEMNKETKKMFEDCVNQEVSSVFGFRRGETVDILCVNCCDDFLNLFKALDVGKTGGLSVNDAIYFKIPKSIIPFIKSFDFVRMCQRYDVMIFNVDEI